MDAKDVTKAVEDATAPLRESITNLADDLKKAETKIAAFSRGTTMSDNSIDQQVVHATRKVQASNPELSYAEASKLALEADPDLLEEYVNSNGTFNRDGGVDR